MMRLSGRYFTSLLVLLLPLFANAAQLSIRENDTMIEFGQTSLKVSLPLTQPAVQVQNVSVALELVDPLDKVRASSVTKVALKISQRQIAAAFDDPLHGMTAHDLNKLFWYRIKYAIRSEAGEPIASGIVPLSTAHTDLFRVAIAAGKYARIGRLYQVEVNTANPVSQKPIRAVEIKGEFSWEVEDTNDSDVKTVTAKGVTDATGSARLDFLLPANIKGREATLTVTGTKGILTRTAEQDINLTQAKVILLDTDKPIYQPGQTVHLRALTFDSQRKAVPDSEVDVTIEDEDNITLLHQRLKTDRFGGAHVDWDIPANLKLGNYLIEVRPHGEEDSPNELFSRAIHIYRYDLPNFSVAVKPDHSYYTKGQNAFVKVSAAYLFGKPVTRGKVRVVEEEERNWNYVEQKWDTIEGETYLARWIRTAVSPPRWI
jgi:hypothetical protein